MLCTRFSGSQWLLPTKKSYIRPCLRTGLSILYWNSDCSALKEAVSFLKFIIHMNLRENMEETKKLLEVLVTTTMTTTEAELNFSTLNRINFFFYKFNVSKLFICFIDAVHRKKIVFSVPNLNDSVINKFVAKKTVLNSSLMDFEIFHIIHIFLLTFLVFTLCVHLCFCSYVCW